MFQTIGEKIEVIGVYARGVFTPKKIKWRQKIYSLEKITLISEIRDGGVKQRMYSCVVGKELYRIMFNRETEIWVLEEIWVE